MYEGGIPPMTCRLVDSTLKRTAGGLTASSVKGGGVYSFKEGTGTVVG